MKRVILSCMLVACGSSGGSPDGPATPLQPQQRSDDSGAAVTALQAGELDVARREATRILLRDPTHARAAAIRAIARFQGAGPALLRELRELGTIGLLHRGAREREEAWTTILDELEVIEQDLAVAAVDPAFSLELCPACWDSDRRAPTYRFDVGDVEWARAMIAFQRAALELALAYDWSSLDQVLLGLLRRAPTQRITIPLVHAAGAKAARELARAGVEHAVRSRTAYLDESDDDREWIANPRQRGAFGASWFALVDDLRRLLASQEGIAFHEGEDLFLPGVLPDAFLDVGALLREPKDIVIDLSLLDGTITERKVEAVLRGALGNGFKQTMKPSPIADRLRDLLREERVN